jgi:hypothetical protein
MGVRKTKNRGHQTYERQQLSKQFQDAALIYPQEYSADAYSSAHRRRNDETNRRNHPPSRILHSGKARDLDL